MFKDTFAALLKEENPFSLFSLVSKKSMKTIVKNALIALLLFGVSGELCAQAIRVSGYVADSRTGETLIGAGVQSEKAGTVT